MGAILGIITLLTHRSPVYPLFLYYNIFLLNRHHLFENSASSASEDALGKAWFIGLYLFYGVTAGFVSVMIRGSDIPSIGASGAIAGLFGMYALWFPKASLTFMFYIYQKKLAVYWYFGIWFVLNIVGMALGDGGIDYWAHLSGITLGLLIGAVLRQSVWEANPMLAYLAGPEAQVKR